MASVQKFPVRLFYSYCHRDEIHRASMEKSLSLLRRQEFLEDWSDHKILPGQRISEAVRKQLEGADIVVFLLSFDFIASDECIKEWRNSQQLGNRDKPRIRIPIILSDCPWQDLLGEDDLKVLPNDGKPVSSYPDQSTAWNEIYQGIKSVVETLRGNFSPKKKLMRSIEETDFVSQGDVQLRDLFVFPPLTLVKPQSGTENELMEGRISDLTQLLSKRFVLLHGDDMSGKTALARHVVLFLVQEKRSVLFVDLKKTHGVATDATFQSIYRDQFNGDYNLWKCQREKTLVLDNLTSAPNAVRFVQSAHDFFERIILTVSTDIYRSFFWDDERLACFEKINIEPLSHVDQEHLIRKRLELMRPEYPISDGIVDEVEERVNSIINNRILPRYPFYILSVIQTFEGFMPTHMSITTHGHCYYVLIIARLIKAGIPNRDEDINVCLNFAEHLAFRVYEYQTLRDQNFGQEEFDSFVSEYRDSYIIRDAILNRLKHEEYGVLTDGGQFRIPYIHYFFLGMYLAKPGNKKEKLIEEICEFSHLRTNHLILLFIVHHAVDQEIIDAILLWSMCAMESVEPARLFPDETARFGRIIGSLRTDLLSKEDVNTERAKERRIRDIGDNHEVDTKGDGYDDNGSVEETNDVYRVLKNNELIGQILSSRYGRLRKERIGEMIEVIADSGLRLVNAVLSSEEDIASMARYVQRVYPERDIGQIRDMLRFLSFLWTMTNIEGIVAAVRHREIREIVIDVARKRGTPAYDIIEYFSALDSADELTDGLNRRLADLFGKYRDPFIRGVLSMRTQHYINTHNSKAVIEQKFCSLLRLPYRHKRRR